MKNLRGLFLLALACTLGLSLLGFATSQATVKQDSSAVAMDASTELALLDSGDVDVLGVTCSALCADDGMCPNGNCGSASSPNCCCKWCNGALQCREKGRPGMCYAE